MKKIPWYKNHILWLIIFFPVFSMVGSITMLVISIRAHEAPIMDGYYKDGLAPKQQEGSLESKVTSARIERGLLYLNSENFYPELILKLEHPIRSAEDKIFELQLNAASSYTLPPELLFVLREEGHWYLLLYPLDNRWQIQGSFQGPVHDEIVFLDGVRR